MASEWLQQKDPSDRVAVILIATFACVSVFLPYAFRGYLQRFDGLLTGQWYAVMLGLFVSGLVLGTILSYPVGRLSWMLGCAPGVVNAVAAMVRCPG